MKKVRGNFHKFFYIFTGLTLSACVSQDGMFSMGGASGTGQITANANDPNCFTYKFVQGLEEQSIFALPIDANEVKALASVEALVDGKAIEYSIDYAANEVTVTDPILSGSVVEINYCLAPVPVPEQPAPEQPAPEQPAPEQPAPEQPASEQPAPEQPAPEQPAPEQPAPEQPAPEQPPVVQNPPAEVPALCEAMVVIREKGKPYKQTFICRLEDPSVPYTVRLDNSGISSGTVDVNGEEIFRQNDLNKKVTRIEHRMMLQAVNEIVVQVQSQPGASFKISIVK